MRLLVRPFHGEELRDAALADRPVPREVFWESSSACKAAMNTVSPPTVALFTTPHYRNLFELEDLQVRTVALPLQETVKAFMAQGTEHDLCILPFVTGCTSLLSTFRAQQLAGPVIFVTEKPVAPALGDTLPENGALLVDLRYERTGFVKSLVRFLLDGMRERDPQHAMGPREFRNVARAIETSYRGEKRARRRQQKPLDQNLAHLLEDALDVPDRLPLNVMMNQKGFLGSTALLHFDVTSRDGNRKVPLCCMARLSSIEVATEPARHYQFFFSDFQPDFAMHFLRPLVQRTLPSVLQDALISTPPPRMPEHTVQFTVETEGVSRSCVMLPTACDDGSIGLVPLTDAFLQKRKYFRTAPSAKYPLTAMISAPGHWTRQAPVIDISERGLSFWHTFPLPINSEVSVFMTWRGVEMVCRGVTRFCEEGLSKSRIGVELYPHPRECARLREYVFRCQAEIMHALRRDGCI